MEWQSLDDCFRKKQVFKRNGNSLDFKRASTCGLSDRLYFNVVFTNGNDCSKNVVVKKWLGKNKDPLKVKELLECVEDPQNLVTLVDHGEDDEGDQYHVYEQEETDLFELQRERKLSDLEIIFYMSDILQGLDVIHGRGFVYCDLKLENIFVTGYRAKLGDLDGAEREVGFKVRSCQVTHGFEPPEYSRDRKYTKQSDIFAAGLILYHLIMRFRPRLRGFVRYCPIPRELTNSPFYSILLKATEEDPDKRYKTVSEMRDELYNVTIGFGTGLPFEELEFAGFGRASDDFEPQEILEIKPSLIERIARTLFLRPTS